MTSLDRPTTVPPGAGTIRRNLRGSRMAWLVVGALALTGVAYVVAARAGAFRLSLAELRTRYAAPESKYLMVEGIELHYRDGKIGEPEHATLRGKGQLSDNVFDLSELKLAAIPELAREAVRRIDAENGSVDMVLVRRNLPDTEGVQLRVYVKSPKKDGYIDADQTGQPL